jgi:hypothetical protein
MKRFLFISLGILMALSSTAQTSYSRVKLFADRQQLIELASKGVIIENGEIREGVFVICELSQDELLKVDESGLEYEVMISDMTTYYQERNEPYLSRLDEMKQMDYQMNSEWPVPDGFELGTCGGFLTIDQCMDHLDSMAAQYPHLITTRSTLDYTTHNGRQLYWVRLSDNPGVDEDETEILYTGMHHAREPIGMQLLIFYMYHLLENYESDSLVKYIVDNFELYFVPILNPDGYAYNIQNQPGGGGNWRKNRRQNDDGSHGVDINRNYAYMWGYNNSGSSPNPGDDTYRGPSAFSEPETMCIRDLIEEHNFRIALNYHSYQNMLLYPWGWTDEPCDHDAVFNRHAAIMTLENAYAFGPGSTTIYPTNGGSDDWMYGEQESKNMIYAYTPEVGGGSDGFWPSVNRIIPLCQENMHQNFMAACLAGAWAEVADLSSTIVENKTGLFFFRIERLGLEDNATYTVSIDPLNDAISSVGDPMTFDDLELFETANAAFTYSLKEDIESGDEILFLLSVNNGLYTSSDTIRKIYGSPVIIFEDSASYFTNWTSSKWNLTTVQSHSPATSIADSPVGQYANYENNSITMTASIDLTGYAYAVLGFWARWDIEKGYDYVQVLISDNNGGSWTPVQGKYTHGGTSNQAYGEPVYDDIQTTWVKEEISLEAYLDKQIKIRFTLVSDVYVVGDGFYWDDMTITVIDMATGIDDGFAPGVENAVKLYPNPSSNKISIAYDFMNIPLRGNSFCVYDVSGRMIMDLILPGASGTFDLDVSTWPEGIYFYSILNDRTLLEGGKFVVR